MATHQILSKSVEKFARIWAQEFQFPNTTVTLYEVTLYSLVASITVPSLKETGLQISECKPTLKAFF